MQNKLLTAGEFAKLALTTKRTITWYADQGILLPYLTSESGYRYYQPQQILDFQVILLLRKLHFSLDEIKAHLEKNNSLKDLFFLKHGEVKKELAEIQTVVENLEMYYTNLETNGTLIMPNVITVSPKKVYYIEREGPYAQIDTYCLELTSYFEKFVKDAVFLSIFLDKGYHPKRAKMHIGVVQKKGMHLKDEAKHTVKLQTLPEYKALQYKHKGSADTLSMIWLEIEKYAKKHNYQFNRQLPFNDLEFYTFKNGELISELHAPIL